MNVEQLIKHFNKTGVFPTVDQLLTAVASDLNYYSIYTLEMQLVEIARNDVNHPYHNAVASYDLIAKQDISDILDAHTKQMLESELGAVIDQLAKEVLAKPKERINK